MYSNLAENEVKALMEEMKKVGCKAGSNFTDFYAEDAIFMPSGEPNMTGKDGKQCFDQFLNPVYC